MNNNVIDQKELENHVVQRYRFKVLGSASVLENSDNDEVEEEEDNKTQEIIVESGGDIDIPESSFVEELLKKSDELSSNIIKLQMQIEKQETEFKSRLEEETKRAREDGFADGYEKAKKELQEQFEVAVKEYVESARKLDDVTKNIDGFLDKLQNDISNTSVEIAKEVIKKEVSIQSSEIAKALAQELIEELKEAVKIVLKVNPEDYETLKEIYNDNKRVEVEADSAVSKGGVVLLSDSGNLDGNLSLRLEKVKYLLQDK